MSSPGLETMLSPAKLSFGGERSKIRKSSDAREEKGRTEDEKYGLQ